MTEFRKYPMHMLHPGYQPAVVNPESADGSGFKSHGIGKPARFPPVTVVDADDEEFYRAKGYEPGGWSDPEAFARAHAVSANMAIYQPIEFPKWVNGVLVKDAEEEAALADGAVPVQVAEAQAPIVETAGAELQREVLLLRQQLEDMRAMVAALAAPAALPAPEEPDEVTPPADDFAPAAFRNKGGRPRKVLAA